MRPVVNLVKLGRLPYAKALSIQHAFFDKLKGSIESESKSQANPPDRRAFGSSVGPNEDSDSSRHRNYILLVEHEPVYTIGIRGRAYDDSYVMKLKQKLHSLQLKADFVQTNRGGLITYHGPGQFVAYPILYLGDFKKNIKNRSVKSYVNTLEATIIDTLAMVGLHGAHTVAEYPGVWLDNGERKIAFIGISCKRYVTMHGISINCDCDLSWFDHIVSCGIEGKAITSVQYELLAKRVSDNQRDENREHEADRKDMINKNLIKSSQGKFANSYLENISSAFCSSFSQHFDCIIQEHGS